VQESATTRITKGMTEAQVRQAIGSPRVSRREVASRGSLMICKSHGGGPVGSFFVDLIDDKVASAKIVRYGGEPNDDFWEVILSKI